MYKTSGTRYSSSTDDAFYSKKCAICDRKKKIETYVKYGISEKGRAGHFLKAAIDFHDDVYSRAYDLYDESAIFGANLFCHKACITAYCPKYDSKIVKQPTLHIK